MIGPEAVAVVLLAAGMSTRFGADDKLAAPLAGRPLGLHAAATFAGIPFATKIVVVGAGAADFAALGYTIVVNPHPAAGQSGSIRLGVAAARTAGAQAVLIALADMPFVTASHIRALLDRFEADHPVVGSTDGHRIGPPALFGAPFFVALQALSGDGGARSLLRTAQTVAAPPAELRDIDTLSDLRSVSDVRRP